MDILELFVLSIQALRGNLMRTMLTMLGIIIGIGSVIIIMSLGQGATASIVDEISSFGANNLTVSPGQERRGPVAGGGSVDSLTLGDVEAIEDRLMNVVAVSATVSGRFQLIAGEENTNVSVSGVSAAHEIVNNVEVSEGLWFDENDVSGQARVVLLGDEVVEDLYGVDAEIVGEKVKIDNRPFRVVGVVQDSSSVFVPVTTAMNVLVGQDWVSSITVMMGDDVDMEIAEGNLEALLLLEHEIDDDEGADFSIRSSAEIIDSVSEVTGVLTLLLGSIAAISLVVGGIGIMNIMLVTVTERTREIGLLKAIGAKRRDILVQFLIESLILTVIGGVAGILVGMGITFVATIFLDIPFVVTFGSVALAVGVSAVVGIVFGYYPARSASGLNPIDALRFE